MGNCASRASVEACADVARRSTIESAIDATSADTEETSVCIDIAVPTARPDAISHRACNDAPATQESAMQTMASVSVVRQQTTNDSLASSHLRRLPATGNDDDESDCSVSFVAVVQCDPADTNMQNFALGSAMTKPLQLLQAQPLFAEVSQQPSKGTIASEATCCRDPSLAAVFTAVSSDSEAMPDLQLEDLPESMTPSAKLTYLLDRIP